MILIIGGSPFVRQALVGQLDNASLPYRLLVQPSKKGVDLPLGQETDLAISSYSDLRGIRSAMQGVKVVYHLSGFEDSASQNDLSDVDVDGLKTITQAAVLSGVERFFYLSSIGADRASGFYFLKAKGIAEAVIRESGLNATIIRTSQVFGDGDYFFTALAQLVRKFRLITPLPADPKTILQPLWINDLVTALVWALEMHHDETLEIGGPEQLELIEIMEIIAKKQSISLKLSGYNPQKYTFITQFLENAIKRFPPLAYWTDFIAENRLCALDSMPRFFGINPARFHNHIDYLNLSSRKRKK